MTILIWSCSTNFDRLEKVGINYLLSSEELQLHGCINDVSVTRELLLGMFFVVLNAYIETYPSVGSGEIDERNIVTLTDNTLNPDRLPTKSNILWWMKWLVHDAKPDDSLFFYCKSHKCESNACLWLSNFLIYAWASQMQETEARVKMMALVRVACSFFPQKIDLAWMFRIVSNRLWGEWIYLAYGKSISNTFLGRTYNVWISGSTLRAAAKLTTKEMPVDRE